MGQHCVTPVQYPEPEIRASFRVLETLSQRIALHGASRYWEFAGRGPIDQVDQRQCGIFTPTFKAPVHSTSAPLRSRPSPGPDGVRSAERAPPALSTKENQVRDRHDSYLRAQGESGFTLAPQSRSRAEQAQTDDQGRPLWIETDSHELYPFFPLGCLSVASPCHQRLDRTAGGFPGDDRSGAFAKRAGREIACGVLIDDSGARQVRGIRS